MELPDELPEIPIFTLAWIVVASLIVLAIGGVIVGILLGWI